MLHLTVAHLISAFGLMGDLLGVLILGFDLLRLQSSLRLEARARADLIKKLYDELVPAEQWADSIQLHATSLKWSRRGGEMDDVIGTLPVALEEVADTCKFLAVRLGALGQLEARRSEQDGRSAVLSFRLSWIGLALIFLGFLLQLAGTFLS
jgi:hypothetical protein